MPEVPNSIVQLHPETDTFQKILFAPVSGPSGIGEYKRSLFLAQALVARNPEWDVRLIISEAAPYVDEVPLPIFRTTRSPTMVPDEVAGILEEFRPNVVIFDCSGRQRSLRMAARLGARTVFISNHKRKRRRGFHIHRLRYTDEHWILLPNRDLTVFERFKLRFTETSAPVFLGPVFPAASLPAHAPEQRFFLCCPGGGGNKIRGRQSGTVFANAAHDVAEALGIHGVVVMGNNYTDELPVSHLLHVHHSLPGHELAGLLSAAEFVMVGGGDLLSQAIASRIPAVSAPSASDQPHRISAYEQRGLCISARPDQLAEVTIAAYSEGRLLSLHERLQCSDITNGLQVGVEHIEMLAVNPRVVST